MLASKRGIDLKIFMTQQNTNRLVIVLIILFPVVMLAFWVYFGFNENRLQRQGAQISTNAHAGQAVETNATPSPKTQ